MYILYYMYINAIGWGGLALFSPLPTPLNIIYNHNCGERGEGNLMIQL
jgi:hypothetical protein